MNALKLHTLVTLTCLLLGSLVAPARAEQQDRPNILWVTSEDNSHHWVGCYGNSDARTPNIDNLAAAGIRYRYAYANTAVCAVARNTLILGRYACGMGTHNMRSRYPVPKQFQTYPSYLRKAGYYCVNRSKTDYNFATDDKSHWDESSPRAHWRNRDKGQPFFAVFNTTISHESSLFQQKKTKARDQGLIPKTPSRDPASVKLPPHYPDTPEIRQDWVTYMDIVTAMDQQIGRWLKELDDAGLRDNTIVFYYSDHGGILPRAKRYINDTGTHVPLIVSFPEKWAHLAPAKSGTVSDRPVAFIDFPATALSLAGLEVPEAFQGRAFAGQAAVEPEPFVFLFGQRFDARMLRFVRGVTDGEYRYIRNFHPHRHRGIFTGYPHGQLGWQSVFKLKQEGKLNRIQTSYWTTPQPAEELYHTASDPWELNNLADDPQHQQRLARMRDATLNKMRDIGDTGLVPESMYANISKQGTVYQYVHRDKFPYEKILQTALLTGKHQPNVANELQRALQHGHPVIRYWGATGCTVHADTCAGARDQLKQLLKDPVPAVRIAATEALYKLGEKKLAMKSLVDILSTANQEMIALEALNLAQALGVMSQIPESVWKKAAQNGKYPQGMQNDPRNPNLQQATAG